MEAEARGEMVCQLNETAFHSIQFVRRRRCLCSASRLERL